jgi:hypothetical protein
MILAIKTLKGLKNFVIHRILNKLAIVQVFFSPLNALCKQIIFNFYILNTIFHSDIKLNIKKSLCVCLSTLLLYTSVKCNIVPYEEITTLTMLFLYIKLSYVKKKKMYIKIIYVLWDYWPKTHT